MKTYFKWLQTIIVAITSFVFTTSLMFLPVVAYAEGNRATDSHDGNLVLDTGVLQDSAVRVGSEGDFPVKVQLFSQDFNDRVSANEQWIKKISEKERSIEFGASSTNSSETYSKALATTQQNLFKGYTPQVLSKTNMQGSAQAFPWLWVIAGLGIALTVAAVFIAQKIAKMKVEKRYE